MTASAVAFQPQHYHTEDPSDDDELELGPGDVADNIDIILPGEAVEIRGRVLDIGGGPIAGARVTVKTSRVKWSGWMNPSTTGFTDDTGTFSVWAMRGAGTVAAEADGYAHARVDIAAPSSTTEIFLTPESVVSGRVVMAGTGEPVSRALVRVKNAWETTYTDKDGRFRVTRLQPGRYKIDADSPGLYGESPTSVLLGLGQTVEEVLIELHPAAIVTGKVLIEGKDEPCRDGFVQLADDRRDVGTNSSISSSGEVKFTVVTPGTYTIRLHCQGYASNEDAATIEIGREDSTGHVWRVAAGGSIVGRIVSATGAGVAEVRVSTTQKLEDHSARGAFASAESNSNGDFEIAGLPAGTYPLNIYQAGEPIPEDLPTIELAAGESKTVEIVLEPSGVIAGRVVDVDGKPMHAVDVESTWLGNYRRRSYRPPVPTGDDGSFEIHGLRAGNYRVIATRSWERLRRPGTSDDDLQGEKVVVRVGKTSQVTLIVEGQSGTITGHVADKNGAPISDAFVDRQRETDRAGARAGRAAQTMRWGWSRQPVLTDTGGNFTVTNLSPGKYTIRAYRNGGGEAIAENVAVGETATLIIEDTGSVGGTVSIEGGSAPERFKVTLGDANSGFSRSEKFYRTDGVFTMNDLPPGSFSLTLESFDGDATAEFSLSEGQTKRGIELVIEKKGSIVGRIVDFETGEPLKGFQTYARPTKGGRTFISSDAQSITDVDGRFRIVDLRATRSRLIAHRRGNDKVRYGGVSKMVDLRSGQELDVGDVRAMKQRIAKGESRGDLGFALRDDRGTDPLDRNIVIALVRKGGPAAGSGLKVGDEIVSVDGHNVTEENKYLYRTLTRVKAGVTLEFELSRGESVTIKVGPRR